MTALSRIRSPDKDRILSQNILRSPFPPIRRSRNSGRYGMRMRRHAPALSRPRGQCLPRLPASALRIFVPAPSAMRRASSLPPHALLRCRPKNPGTSCPRWGIGTTHHGDFSKTGGDSPPAGLGRRLIAPACPFSSTERRPSAFSAKAPPKHGASTALNLMRSRLIRLRSTRSERGRPRLRRRSAVRAGRPR